MKEFQFLKQINDIMFVQFTFLIKLQGYIKDDPTVVLKKAKYILHMSESLEKTY